MYLKVNLRIFLFAIIFYFTGQIEMYGRVMFFAFLHELGHLFVGLLLGFRVRVLAINPLGLTVKFGINVKDYNKKIKKGNWLALKKTIIACSGPAVNFAIALIMSTCNARYGENAELKNILYTNIVIGIFNLIPIYPLDGGQILKNILHIKYGLEKSHRYTNETSNILVIAITAFSSIAIYCLENIAVLFIVIYLWNLVIKENKIHSQRLSAYRAICYMENKSLDANKKEIC